MDQNQSTPQMEEEERPHPLNSFQSDDMSNYSGSQRRNSRTSMRSIETQTESVSPLSWDKNSVEFPLLTGLIILAGTALLGGGVLAVVLASRRGISSGRAAGEALLSASSVNGGGKEDLLGEEASNSELMDEKRAVSRREATTLATKLLQRGAMVPQLQKYRSKSQSSQQTALTTYSASKIVEAAQIAAQKAEAERHSMSLIDGASPETHFNSTGGPNEDIVGRLGFAVVSFDGLFSSIDADCILATVASICRLTKNDEDDENLKALLNPPIRPPPHGVRTSPCLDREAYIQYLANFLPFRDPLFQKWCSVSKDYLSQRNDLIRKTLAAGSCAADGRIQLEKFLSDLKTLRLEAVKRMDEKKVFAELDYAKMGKILALLEKYAKPPAEAPKLLDIVRSQRIPFTLVSSALSRNLLERTIGGANSSQKQASSSKLNVLCEDLETPENEGQTTIRTNDETRRTSASGPERLRLLLNGKKQLSIATGVDDQKVTDEKKKLSVYIGGGMNDLLGALEADVGILLVSKDNSDESTELREICKHFGIQVSPLWKIAKFTSRNSIMRGNLSNSGGKKEIFYADNIDQLRIFFSKSPTPSKSFF